VSIVPEDDALRRVWENTIFVDQPDPRVPSVMPPPATAGASFAAVVLTRSALAFLAALCAAAYRILTFA
jgi:hypothetical protein